MFRQARKESGPETSVVTRPLLDHFGLVRGWGLPEVVTRWSEELHRSLDQLPNEIQQNTRETWVGNLFHGWFSFKHHNIIYEIKQVNTIIKTKKTPPPQGVCTRHLSQRELVSSNSISSVVILCAIFATVASECHKDQEFPWYRTDEIDHP